ncbi:hypothetical protein [Dankookia sp. P2]|uniref:hypothetical protein n=1 Tax=Dankookia sp. P2 TaxID=3423955 RepID=UPI003D67CF80
MRIISAAPEAVSFRRSLQTKTSTIFEIRRLRIGIEPGHEAFLGQQDALVEHQGLKEVELACGQVDPLAVDHDRMLFLVQGNVAADQLGRSVAACPARHGLHPGMQHRQADRVEEDVVGPGMQRGLFLLRRCRAGAGQDHRQGHAAATQVAQSRQGISQRLTDPQKHQVVRTAEGNDGGQFADALGRVAQDAELGQGGFEVGGGTHIGGDCNAHVISESYNALLGHMIVCAT